MKKYLIIIGSIILALGIGVGAYFLILGKIEAKIIGDSEIKVTYKEDYQDLGVELLRNNELLPIEKYQLTIDNPVDTNTLGTYNVSYDIKYHLKKYHLERKVIVVDDIKPDITTNIETIERDFCSKKDKVKLTYTANDNYDGDITSQVEIVEEEDNINVIIKDSNGNEAKKIIPISYTKKPNPVFKLNGNNTVYVILNSKYSEQGASYTDGCGNKINETIKTSGTVDSSKEGTYKITYSLNDGKSLTRSVVVYKPSSTAKGKVIYLTFDDGPGVYTEKILGVLNKYNVKATFFVTNQFPKYVSLIKKEYEQGHSVAVHTYTHNYNVYKSVSTYIADFNKMNDVIKKYTGSKAKIFRFPGGSSNTVSRNYAKGVVRQIANQMTKDGYKYFDWNVTSGDASGASRSKIYSNVVNGVTKCTTCVVLMHDIKYNTAYELDNILKTLTSKGYKFGTLSINSPTVHHTIAN